MKVNERSKATEMHGLCVFAAHLTFSVVTIVISQDIFTILLLYQELFYTNIYQTRIIDINHVYNYNPVFC